ncbi:hypothetical protein [Umezawaea sp. Da 62-37]|uniref:hypothetical protein n=1 Tax=Umezawaea sp. Da 62-37 TaxID=3075927 RepID=UPI0028F6ED9A|nr:hypothetical protein [Umezawaea sp. Da 62-37]WNV84227.1 hypothetical protein RM788_39625 [Umezawaea sp. Da 62-37]
MSPAEYQAALTKFDEAVRPALERVGAAGADVDFGAAQQELAEVLDAQSSLLTGVVPPNGVAGAHRSLAGGLSIAAISIRTMVVAAAAPNSCGITVPTLPAAKVELDDKVRDLGTTYFEPLTTLGFRIGSFVPPPLAAVQQEERRAGNGEVVLRNGGQGPGTLKITNGTPGDIAVSVVSGDPSNPQVTVYVQGSSDASVSGIAGDYEVYFKSGVDWDAGRNGFTRDCSFEKFDDLFTGESDWSIDLQATPAGNASTSDVPAF